VVPAKGEHSAFLPCCDHFASCQRLVGALRSVLKAVAMTALPTCDNWQLRAACRGQSAAIFFAPSHFERNSARSAREAKAKAVCSTCPVRQECLAYALRTHEANGIWGGLNEEERKLVTAR